MKPNDYSGFSWQDLGVIAGELRERLEKRVPTRANVELDDRIAALLGHLHYRINIQPFMPYGALQRVRRFGPAYFAVDFMEVARTEQANARARLLSEAAGYVMGGDGHFWENSACLPGPTTPHMAALASDDGLRAGLELLQQRLTERGRTQSDSESGD